MSRRILGRIALLTACLLHGAATLAGDPYITANALFDGRAMLSINGRAQMLRVGQTSAEGVKLVAADARSAVIEFDGRRQTLAPGRDLGGGFATVERHSTAVHRNERNEYLVVGSINGRQVQFLIDTGANVVALNSIQATALGIDYRLNGSPSRVQTASGVVPSWAVMLDRVELAGIVVRNVQASVIEGSYPERALLGMSWLSRASLRNENGVLYIEER